MMQKKLKNLVSGADFSYFSGYDEDLTVYAYNKARQARFEYGECG